MHRLDAVGVQKRAVKIRRFPENTAQVTNPFLTITSHPRYHSWFESYFTDVRIMVANFKLTNEFVITYRESALTLDTIMREHQLAMVVFDIQDTVGYGIVTMQRWIRCLHQWEEWVAESADGYNQTDDDKIRSVGAELLDIGSRVDRMIRSVNTAGYAVEGQEQFAELLGRIRGIIEPIPAAFQRNVLQAFHDEATRDYIAGNTEEISNPWRV